MIRYLLTFFSVCIVHCAIAQTLIPRFESFGINDGLPHSSVYSILQDKKGFMWFGTADGLCRYDGSVLQTFKYKPRVEMDVVNNFVRGKMLEDKTGNIWFCNESGIYKWDVFKEAVQRVRPFDKKEYNNATFQLVCLDDGHNIWLYNYLHGLMQFNINTGMKQVHPLPFKINFPTFIIKFIEADTEGNIWLRVGSKSDPFFVFNLQTKQYSIKYSKDPPHAIFFDKKIKVLAYEDRLEYPVLENGPSGTIPKLVNGIKTPYYSFDGMRDNFGRLWMTARGNGLFYYDEKQKLFHEFHHDNSKLKSLPFDLTSCLYIDRNENLWIGTDGAGVAKLDLKQPKFNLFPLSEGDFPVLNDYFTKCFYEDKAGRIWFGTQTNGLNIFDPVLQQLTNYHHEKDNPKSLPGNMVGQIFKDRDGNIWIGSSGGFSIFNEKKSTFKTIQVQNLPKLNTLLDNLVYKIIQLQNGSMLAATILGIIKIDKQSDGSFRGTYHPDNGAISSNTTDIAEMPDKTVFATLPGLGLYQFKPKGESYISVNTFLNGIDLRSIRRDEKNPGYLWIGSSKGLLHFNTATHQYRTWNEKNGMANSYVYGSLEDAAGNFWISTNKGLSHFNYQKNTFENFSFLDGLQSNEFNTQSFYKSNTGIFYFGGIKGFNWFSPGYINKETLKPVAAITGIEINDVNFEKDSTFVSKRTIEVDHDKNDFDFRFAVLDYTRPEANKVNYFLEGWDRYPVTTENKSVRYSNLPPGNYTLRLKVSNADGNWSNEEIVQIKIRSPYWKSTWFIATMIVLGLLIIIYSTYYLSQVKAKRKLQLLEKQVAVDAERDRISADMHDEVGSGITQIALLSELIQTQQKDTVALKRDIHIISKEARKLVQTMSDIIWALNPQNDTLDNLLAYTREQSKQYFEPFDIEFNIIFPDVPEIKLSNAVRRNVYLVTREALNNALKHSGASIITLQVALKDRHFCFTINDNGTGLNKETDGPGKNGLRNMRKRMADIGGTISWTSTENGTTVVFTCRY